MDFHFSKIDLLVGLCLIYYCFRDTTSHTGPGQYNPIKGFTQKELPRLQLGPRPSLCEAEASRMVIGLALYRTLPCSQTTLEFRAKLGDEVVAKLRRTEIL